MSSTVLSTTQSVCPVCLERIPASRVAYGRKVYLEKDCPRHGHFKTKIWGGQLPYEGWANEKIPSAPINGAGVVQRGCPYDCGLCPEHRQHTCCVLLEVTQRCSLGCPICYASAGSPQGQDPSLEDIGQRFDEMMRCGGPFNIQLSGGEPTEREDLPEIIRMGRERVSPFSCQHKQACASPATKNIWAVSGRRGWTVSFCSSTVCGTAPIRRCAEASV